jgi:hypothetical protein
MYQELVRAHETGAEVSVMTYKDGLYQFSVSMPEPVRFDSGEDFDEDEDDEENEDTADERLWQHYCTMAKGLDVDELIADTLHQARDEVESPLRTLLEDWIQTPQFDWQRPLVAPSTCESLGRWLAGLAAESFHQSVGAAMAEGD